MTSSGKGIEDSVESEDNDSFLFPSASEDDGGWEQRSRELVVNFPIVSRYHDSPESVGTSVNVSPQDWPADRHTDSSLYSFPLASKEVRGDLSSVSSDVGKERKFLFPISIRPDSGKTAEDSSIRRYEALSANNFTAKSTDVSPRQETQSSQKITLTHERFRADDIAQSKVSNAQVREVGRFGSAAQQNNSVKATGWSIPVIEFPPLASFDSDGICSAKPNTLYDFDDIKPSEILSVFESEKRSSAFQKQNAKADRESRQDNFAQVVDSGMSSTLLNTSAQDAIRGNSRYEDVDKPASTDNSGPRWWKLLLVGVVVFVVEFVLLNFLA
ncbi:hypothetical protein OZX73_07580 [Bifidobacterium sp. ESL0775]|uniref:hypothetical protein n=1 Tax=Bifidobacterium sp. ESL0775 TaxID=2983230 RepID=UPI0023F9AE56|nr:hypothetical protein [Bifidobacterium sp. ESL0775]WEV69109.1 hypothetical protein OZX73_07580 [Bifidobacterium sp. ESL0775]